MACLIYTIILKFKEDIVKKLLPDVTEVLTLTDESHIITRYLTNTNSCTYDSPAGAPNSG